MKGDVMKRLKQVLVGMLILAMVLTPGPSFAMEEPKITAKGAIVMDYDTGQVLYEKNADKAYSSASMAKVMTAYLILDAIHRGDLSWDTMIPISDKARTQSPWDKTPFAEEERLGDLFDPYMVRSNNQMGIAIAEYMGGGSEDGFVDQMNQKARDLGLDASYTEANGLKPNQVTARAQALLTRSIIQEYPEILKTTAKHQARFKDQVYRSTNKFYRDFRYFKGVDGFKTGSAPYSGQCLTTTCTRRGRRLISVVMGSQGKDRRYYDTMKIINYACELSTTSPWAKDVPKRADRENMNTAAYKGLATFRGREPMSRGEFTLLMALTLALPMEEGQTEFRDVPEDAYYAKAIAAAKKAGLVDGYGEGIFRPEKLISREEMARMVYVAMGYDDASVDPSFKDWEQIHPLYCKAVAGLTARKILHGRSGGLFAPQGTASREEASLMMLNLRDQVEKKS